MNFPVTSRSFDNPAAETSQFLIRLGLAVLTILVPTAALASRRAIFLLFPLGAGVILIGALLAPRRDAAARMQAAAFTRMGFFALLLVMWAACFWDGSSLASMGGRRATRATRSCKS